MATRSLQDQTTSLRRMASGGLGRWLVAGLAAAVGACLVVGWLKAWPPLFVIAIFLAVVAFAAKQAMPHLRRAARSLDVGRREPVMVAIEVAEGSDLASYHAVVTTGPALTWRMEFIAQGWKPATGTFAAQAHFLADVKWPVLLVTEAGLIFPRYEPKRLPPR